MSVDFDIAVRPAHLAAKASKAEAAIRPPLVAKQFRWRDPKTIPPREWQLGTLTVRKFMSLLVAAGGAGKTSLSIGAALSVVTGRQIIGEYVHDKAPVWIFNLEDPEDEMDRRVAAAMLHHKVQPCEVEGMLFINSGRERPLVVASHDEEKGSLIVYPDRNPLIAEAREMGIGLIIVDPFVSSHEVDENSPKQMDSAAKAWTHIADQVGCAVLLVHHTRKANGSSQAGDIEVGRGAKSLSDACRVGMTLATMTNEEAKSLGVPVEQRKFIVRLDDPKANMSPVSDAKWFKLCSVSLGNGTDLYPNGDQVQAIERWYTPKPFAGLTDDAVNQCLDAIAKGLPDGQMYGASTRGNSKRYAGELIAKMLGKTEAQATTILKSWQESGLVFEDTYTDPKSRREASYLRVDDQKRPGTATIL